jgi:uncharacterized protein (DUF488 family)
MTADTGLQTAPDLVVFSVGHSDLSLESFVDLLRKHGISAIVDVRSQPYSQWVPQYNREVLARNLASEGIHYEYLGTELGGRPADRSLYAPGVEHPDYDRLRSSPGFASGLQALLRTAAERRTAMMCAEADYRHCHRHELIAPALLARQVRVLHIRPDGQLNEASPEGQQLRLL